MILCKFCFARVFLRWIHDLFWFQICWAISCANLCSLLLFFRLQICFIVEYKLCLLLSTASYWQSAGAGIRGSSCWGTCNCTLMAHTGPGWTKITHFETLLPEHVFQGKCRQYVYWMSENKLFIPMREPTSAEQVFQRMPGLRQEMLEAGPS